MSRREVVVPSLRGVPPLEKLPSCEIPFLVPIEGISHDKLLTEACALTYNYVRRELVIYQGWATCVHGEEAINLGLAIDPKVLIVWTLRFTDAKGDTIEHDTVYWRQKASTNRWAAKLPGHVAEWFHAIPKGCLVEGKHNDYRDTEVPLPWPNNNNKHPFKG